MDSLSNRNTQLPSFLLQPTQIIIPTEKYENILCIVTPLSKSSLQFIFTKESSPKPSGEIFRIAYDELEIRQYVMSREFKKINVEEDVIEEGNDTNQQEKQQNENETNYKKNSEGDFDFTPFDINQVMGNRFNDALNLPMYRVAVFGLNIIKSLSFMSLRELFVVWSLKVDEKDSEQINDITKSIEKAFKRLMMAEK